MLLVLDVPDEVLAHLVRAIALYRRQLRADGIGPLPSWEQFARAVATKPDHVRQGAPLLADPNEASDTHWHEPPLLLDKRQVGTLLNVSARSLDRLIAAGKLPIVKIGARSLIRRTDLETFVGMLKVGTADA